MSAVAPRTRREIESRPEPLGAAGLTVPVPTVTAAPLDSPAPEPAALSGRCRAVASVLRLRPADVYAEPLAVADS